MKHLIFLFFAFAPLFVNAQTVVYFYDESGNRIERGIRLSQLRSTEPIDENEPVFEERFSENNLRIYPNPTKGLLTVEISNSENNVTGKVMIADMNGKIIFQQQIVSGRMEFDLTAHPTGIYLMKIMIGEEITSWKIIKE